MASYIDLRNLPVTDNLIKDAPASVMRYHISPKYI